MQELLKSMLMSVRITDIIDVAIITIVIYKILQLIKGARAYYMVASVFGLIVIVFAANTLGLRTTEWLLSNITGYLFLLIVILFQPELRRAFVILGETRILGRMNKTVTNKLFDEVVRAASILANRQIGALIVLQRKMELVPPTVTLGQKLDSEVSKDLLLSIFIPYSPLHDGAVIIDGGRISYAGCILPLTKRDDIKSEYGTRHRAAIGITEETDAVVVVVSEERGAISLVSGGLIASDLDSENLQKSLENLFNVNEDKMQ